MFLVAQGARYRGPHKMPSLSVHRFVPPAQLVSPTGAGALTS
jgi:hypothetical protein